MTVFEVFWQKEIEKIKACFEHGEALRICGLYGIGKCLLANICQQSLAPGPNRAILFLDLKNYENLKEQDFLKILANKVKQVFPGETNLAWESDFDLHYFFRQKLEDNAKLKIAFIFQEAQNLAGFSPSFFDLFEKLRYYFSSRVFVLAFFQPKPLFSQNAGVKRLFKKIIFLRPFDLKTTLADIELEAEKLQTVFSPAARKLIVRMSKGHHGTIRFLCELAKGCGREGIEFNKNFLLCLAKKNPLFEVFLSLVWQNFAPEEQNLLVEFLKTKSLSARQLHSPAFHALHLLGVFKRKSVHPVFLFDAFYHEVKSFVKNQATKDNVLPIEFKNSNLFLNSLPAAASFTKSELAFLKCLYLKKNEIVNFEDLGRSVWQGKNLESKYSLWAINKIVSRLRRRLADFNVSPLIIKTIRGKGYLLES